MRLRSVLTGLAGGLAVAAGVHRSLETRAGPLSPALSGRDRTYRWRGYDVRYVEAGDPDRPDVVLLHGIHAAASAREFHRIFGALAGRYHVLAPDLPGFGTSDRPPVVYDGGTYEGFLRDFLADVADEPLVVASSLTASFAAVAAAETPVSGLVLVNLTEDTGSRSAAVRELFRLPVIGQALFDLLVSRPSIAYFDRRFAYADPGALEGDVVDYQWRTAHQPNARYAPASFVGGFLEPSRPLADSLGALDVPVTLVWGNRGPFSAADRRRALAETADATLVVIAEAAGLVHEEHPDAFIDAIRDALPRLEHD
ncbi:MAG: alpha/beta fold hydrolase [Halanaeroarchaeum sp.]